MGEKFSGKPSMQTSHAEAAINPKQIPSADAAITPKQIPPADAAIKPKQMPPSDATIKPKQIPPAEAAIKPKPTSKENFMLLGALVTALIFNLFCTPIKGLWHYSVFYCTFFLVFAAVMLLINRDALKGRAEVFFILGAAGILMAKLIYVDFKLPEESFLGWGVDLVLLTANAPNPLDSVLSPLNTVLIIPALLMIIPVVMTYGLYENGIAYFVKTYFVTAFFNLFRFMGKPFTAMRRAFKNKGRKGNYVFIGFLIGIPVFILLAALLILSDAAMKAQLSVFFQYLKQKPFEILLRVIFIITPMFMLSYSLVYSVLYRNEIQLEKRKTAARFNDTSAAIILCLMLAAYLIFGIFRFAYITGIFGLPEGLTYSEYAVNGFTELSLITFINISVFALIFTFCKNKQGKPNKPIQGLLIGLLIATALLLVSAVYRLSLYIGAYGLTVKRVLALWFENAIFIVLIFCTVKLIKPKFRAAYFGSAAIISWYLILNTVNIGKFISV